MKIKIYVQPFVLPYLEATKHTTDFQLSPTSPLTQLIINNFQELSKTTSGDIYRQFEEKTRTLKKTKDTYHQPITIEIDETQIPLSKIDLIRATFIVSFNFSKHVKTQIYTQFMELMMNHFIINSMSISTVIDNFYTAFFLDEDTLPSQNLRKHWQLKKPYKKEGFGIFRNQLLSTQHLSDTPPESN